MTASRFKWLLCFSASLFLVSCRGEKNGPPATVFKEVKFKKVAVWVEKGSVRVHFGIANEQDQELAMSGTATLEFFAESTVNVEGQPSFQVKSPIFQATRPVKLEDFQWIYYHSFLTRDDFVCRFRIKLEQFKAKPVGGRYLKFKITFKPDAYAGLLEMEKNVWIPRES